MSEEFNMNCWDKLLSVIGISDRILLYGVAGTGKTYQANRLGLKKGQGTYNITLTADSTATELMGHYIATSDGGFRWKDGNGVRAFKEGARLVVNEIDHAGADVQTFLHALLDDKEFAGFNLPNDEGEFVKPMENFQCIATMNGYPEDLPEPLADRFPVKINVDSVHPDALEGLGSKLRAIYLDADRTSFSVRKWIELRKLMESDVPNEEAVKVLFPDEDEQFALLVALGIQKEQYPDEEDE
tara:strand:+ start:41 stop:766 length:726 start_codon:yes stop_codon:yes gene_type:complete